MTGALTFHEEDDASEHADDATRRRRARGRPADERRAVDAGSASSPARARRSA